MKEQDYPEMLFLFPNFEEDFSILTFAYHLGTGYILAYLKDKGIHATQFIHKEPIGLDELTEKILKQRPKIVGLTCYDTNYYFVKLISQLLKKKDPRLIIIIGGPTATFSDELIMHDNPAIDTCVRGDGEYTVYELIKRLRVSLDVSDIEGITYRLRGRIIQTPDRPLIRGEKKGEELDILSSPYLRDIFPPNENLGILTSRGCIFKCVYCNFSAMSRWTIRYHSVERVISELKTIHNEWQSDNKKTDNRFVEIFDDAFSLDIERAKQICCRIIEEGIILPYWTQTRADRVDRELLQLMLQAGFQEINFGLESVVPKVLNTIKKVRERSSKRSNLIPEKRFIEKVRKNVKFAKKIGLRPTVSVILGLPAATARDDKKTLEFVRQLKVERYYHDYLSIFSGTELFTTYKQYGLKVKQSSTVLPYRTEYAYDIYKVPEMKHSHQRLIRKEQTERLMRIFTGEYRNREEGSYSDLLFRNYSVDNKTIEWLRRSIAMSQEISFVGNYFDDGAVRHNIEKMISANLLVMNFYVLTAFSKKDANPADCGFESNRYEITFVTYRLLQRMKSFSRLGFVKFIPLVNYGYNRSVLLDLKNKGIDKIIFTLSTLDDLEKLAGLVFHSDKVVLEGEMMNFDCYCLDECRWSDKDCPLKSFPRAIIENDGLIIPCFNGKPIAKVGDERRDIIKNLKLLWNDMKKKRNCGDCLVKDNCSKCLFPYPINSKEFCQMRRKKYPYIASVNKIFKLLKIIRQIRTFDDKLQQKSKIEKVVGIFDYELVIVNVDKKRYLYHHRFDTLYIR